MPEHEFLRGMKGGPKQKWIREHRDLIMDYCEAFGAEDTCKEFYMKSDTLIHLYRDQHQEMPYTTADRALDVAKMGVAGVRELRGNLNRVEGKLENIEYEVAHQVADLLIEPWLHAANKIKLDLEEKRRIHARIRETRLIDVEGRDDSNF